MALKPFRNPDLCPQSADHRMGPINHVDWVEWADHMAETHEQAQCSGCDLWVIWVPLEDRPYPQRDEAQTGRQGDA